MTDHKQQPAALYRKRGRRYEPIPDQLDGWSGFMATCAVRYCSTQATKVATMSRRARQRRDKRAPIPDFDDHPHTEADPCPSS